MPPEKGTPAAKCKPVRICCLLSQPNPDKTLHVQIR